MIYTEKIGMVFLLFSVVDLYQVANGASADIDFVYLLFAVIPGLIGAGGRILKESEKVLISGVRMLFIIFCSLILSIGAFFGSDYLGSYNAVGIVSLGLGLMSVSIINFLIDDLPKFFPEILRHFLKMKKPEDNDLD